MDKLFREVTKMVCLFSQKGFLQMRDVAYREVSIETLQGGAVLERINHEMLKIYKNISDINTDPKANRELGLKIKFVPTEDRHSAGISVSCSSKLVSGEAMLARIYFEEGTAFEPKEPVAGSLFDNVDPLEMTEPIQINTAKKGKAS
jgi:hypothetical protein